MGRAHFSQQGFVVIQPTHLDSKTLPFRDSAQPGAPLFWQSRAADFHRLLDQLSTITAALPGLLGRVDLTQVAILGHSLGGHTASLMLGASHKPSVETPAFTALDPRIKAGVLLAAPGRGAALTPEAAQRYPFFTTVDFTTLTSPTLVVYGDEDDPHHLSTAGPTWFADPFHLAPGANALVTVFGGGHGLGGVAGYDLAETTDEHPTRVATVLQLGVAYLKTQLNPADSSWHHAIEALTHAEAPLARVTTK